MSDGVRLRRARQEQGRQQREVAQAAGLSPQYLNDLEYGRRVAPRDTYHRLCEVLGIDNHRPDAEPARLRAEIDALNARFAQQPSAPANGPSEGQMRAALQAFLSDRWTLRIPPQPDDPDMILDAAITELLALRRTLAAIGALAGGGCLVTIFLTKAEYAAITGEAAKGSKYGNERVTTEDGTFDSLGEHRRWEELRLRERAGEIANLKRQVAFALIVGDVKVATYVADFTYDESGVPIVEDFKGVRTEGYKIKAKLMLACHRIAIRETGRDTRRKR